MRKHLFHSGLLISALSLPSCSQSSSFKGGTPTGAAAAPAPDYSSDQTTENKVDVPGKSTRVAIEDYIQEAATPTADILLVVDDSGSMAAYQKNLSSKLSVLVQEIQDTDWQVGVITTSVKTQGGVDTCSLKLIKKDDVDANRKFEAAVSAGTSGSSDEQGLRQARNGLACPESPWIRDKSSLAVLIITDEEDASKEDLTFPLISYVENDLGRTVGVNAGFYGIFSPPSNPCNVPNATAGQRYQGLFDYKNVSGEINYGRVCEDTYKPTLELISKSIAKLASEFYTLADAPDLGTLVIKATKADGTPITEADYTINGKIIQFKQGNQPSLGSKVTVTYRVTVG